MRVSGVGGALMETLGLPGWVFGSSLGEVGRSFLDRFTRFEVGVGSKISFWHDMWCGEQPLMEAFPELFSIACFRDASVDDYL
jgi:hypothetical protein